MSISTGSMGVGVMAILSGLVGAYGLRAVLNREPPPKAPSRTITVPLASANLNASRTIAFGDIVLQSFTREQLIDRNMPLELLMTSTEQIIGRTLNKPVKQGQPFLTTSFYLEGTKGNIMDGLPPGYRAFSIQVPDVRGGGVSTDARVDVVFRSTFTPAKDGRPEIPEITKVLMQNVLVIGVERPTASGPRRNSLDIRYINGRSSVPPPPTVTLALTPEELAVMHTVQGKGELMLAPRAINEPSFVAVNDEEMTFEKLMNIKLPDPPPAPEPPPQLPYFVTEVYKGPARGSRIFDAFELERAGLLKQVPPPAAEPNQKSLQDYPMAGDGPQAPWASPMARGQRPVQQSPVSTQDDLSSDLSPVGPKAPSRQQAAPRAPAPVEKPPAGPPAAKSAPSSKGSALTNSEAEDQFEGLGPREDVYVPKSTKKINTFGP